MDLWCQVIIWPQKALILHILREKSLPPNKTSQVLKNVFLIHCGSLAAPIPLVCGFTT